MTDKRGERLYRAYISTGADALDEQELRKAFEFQDTELEAASRIRRKHENEQREAADREAARDEWLARGEDARAFEREWPKIKQEREAARLREMDRGAKEAFARLGWEAF
jgi:hypothetical protein